MYPNSNNYEGYNYNLCFFRNDFLDYYCDNISYECDIDKNYGIYGSTKKNDILICCSKYYYIDYDDCGKCIYKKLYLNYEKFLNLTFNDEFLYTSLSYYHNINYIDSNDKYKIFSKKNNNIFTCYNTNETFSPINDDVFDIKK